MNKLLPTYENNVKFWCHKKKNASVFPVSDLITMPQKGNKEEKKKSKSTTKKKKLEVYYEKKVGAPLSLPNIRR
jgi:hypothetical protein